MKEDNIANAYAKAITAIAQKNNIDVASELTQFCELINKNNDFENVLFSQVFTLEEKLGVLRAVLGRMTLSSEVNHFLLFILQEKRISLLPTIFKNVIVLDDARQGFLRGSIEGGQEQVSEAIAQKITAYLEKKLGKKVELKYKQKKNITAGHRVVVEDLQLDASLEGQLKRFKQSALS